MRGSPKSGKRRSPSGPRRQPWELEEELRQELEPLIADPPRRDRNPGRRRTPPIACLQGLLYLLFTGGRYIDLPPGLGFPSGETCRRRLHEWIERGVWERVLEILIVKLDRAGKLDWSRLVIDASIIDAKRGAILSARAR
jgi:transposase